MIKTIDDIIKQMKEGNVLEKLIIALEKAWNEGYTGGVNSPDRKTVITNPHDHECW